MNSTIPWESCSTARTSPSGTQRNAWSVRPGWQDGRVKSIIWLMGCPPSPLYFFMLPIFLRQEVQMQ